MAMSPVQRESALGLVHCFPEVPQAGMDGAELMVNPSFQLVVSSGLTEAERMPALRYGRVGLPDTRKAGAANPAGPALPPGIVPGQLHGRFQCYRCAVGPVGADEGVRPPDLSRPEIGSVLHEGEGVPKLAVERVCFEEPSLVPETVRGEKWRPGCARYFARPFPAGEERARRSQPPRRGGSPARRVSAYEDKGGPVRGMSRVSAGRYPAVAHGEQRVGGRAPGMHLLIELSHEIRG